MECSSGRTNERDVTLSYQTLSFEVFLSKCQTMFNIFEQQEEPMTEEDNVRFLLKKTLHPQMTNAVETMQPQMSLNLSTLTVTALSSILASRVSELPDYIRKEP